MSLERTPEASAAPPSAVKEPLIQVRVWGARGSIPTPSSAVLKYGGNTPCVEVIVKREIGCDQRLIFDAGTGIRNLGLDLIKTKSVDCDFHIFLTHFHWDHVQGLPFFPALYNKATTITFYSSRTPEELREILWGQMATPYFPVRFDDLLATVSFVQIDESPLKLGEFEVSTFCLTHPQGAAGFRVVHKGKSVVYATDHEHGNAESDLRLLNAARGADVLFYDAQYTPEEYPTRRGWGHGTWLEATKVAAHAGVKRLVLFHHDPSHDDVQLDNILKLARAEFPETYAATEGETILVE